MSRLGAHALNHLRGVVAMPMRRTFASIAILLAAAPALRAQANAPAAQPGRATRVAIAQQMPPLDGAKVKVSVIEVNYAPGASSAPHSHPCPVIGYVAEGLIR